jgi:hypothetical protein
MSQALLFDCLPPPTPLSPKERKLLRKYEATIHEYLRQNPPESEAVEEMRELWEDLSKEDRGRLLAEMQRLQLTNT